MKNVEVKLEGTKLTITCDVEQDFGKSSSGKTNVIATSEGNQTVGTRKGGQEIKMGLNLYYKP